ncbi:hypothetical protein FQR65_LT08314 [Abscondita terminalis]|nr:hypothetical protein FQR65_LT08314 [Abscondita terminalis]
MQIFQTPLTVTAFLCSNARDSANMMKMLSRKGIAARVNFPGIYPIWNSFPPNHALYVIDLNCKYSFELLKQADEKMFFSSPYRWFLINNNLNFHDVINLLATVQILPDSDVTLAQRIENGFELMKLYKLERGGLVIEDKLGYWYLNQQKLCVKEWKLMERKRLGRIVLNTSLVITDDDTLNHLIDHKNKHIDTISKVCYVLLQHLADILNVTYKYKIQNTWGYQNNDSNWNGMIGDLQRHDAVIGGTAVFLRGDRFPVVDYVGMTIPTRSKFVFRQPKLSYVENVYILPFNWSVWASVGVMVIFLVIALHSAQKWEWTLRKDISEKINYTEEPNWVHSSLIAFGAICQQASSTVPSGGPGRTITVLMFISLMFIYTAYSANIVALLQSSSNSIQTLNDLLHSRITIGVDDTVFNRFYFPNAKEPVRKAIYEQKVAPPKQKPNYFSIKEGVQLLRNGVFAFHMETGVGYKFVLETFEEHEKCGLKEIQFLEVTDPALAIQKNSPYNEFIKIGLMQIRETGLQSREVSSLYTKKPVCSNRASSFISVSLVDCYLIAAVASVGITLAFIILLFEIAFHRKFKCM